MILVLGYKSVSAGVLVPEYEGIRVMGTRVLVPGYKGVSAEVRGH